MPESITFTDGDGGETSVPVGRLAEEFVAGDAFEPLSEARSPNHRILAWIAHYETEEGHERWHPLPKGKISALRDRITELEQQET